MKPLLFLLCLCSFLFRAQDRVQAASALRTVKTVTIHPVIGNKPMLQAASLDCWYDTDPPFLLQSGDLESNDRNEVPRKQRTLSERPPVLMNAPQLMTYRNRAHSIAISARASSKYIIHHVIRV